MRGLSICRVAGFSSWLRDGTPDGGDLYGIARRGRPELGSGGRMRASRRTATARDRAIATAADTQSGPFAAPELSRLLASPAPVRPLLATNHRGDRFKLASARPCSAGANAPPRRRGGGGPGGTCWGGRTGAFWA